MMVICGCVSRNTILIYSYICVYTHLIFHSTMTKLVRHVCIELIVCVVRKRLYCTVQALSFHSPRPHLCIVKNENKETVPQG